MIIVIYAILIAQFTFGSFGFDGGREVDFFYFATALSQAFALGGAVVTFGLLTGADVDVGFGRCIRDELLLRLERQELREQQGGKKYKVFHDSLKVCLFTFF